MPHERELAEQQLWELLYDLLSPEEAQAVRDRLAADPEWASAYAAIVAQRELVAQALAWDGEEIILAIPPDEAAGETCSNGKPSHAATPRSARLSAAGKWRRKRVGRWLRPLAAIAAGLLLAWIGYGAMGPASPLDARGLARAERAIAQKYLRLTIAAPDRLTGSPPQSVSVTVSTLMGEPVATEIGYRFFLGDRRQPEAQGRAATDADGHAAIDAPVIHGESRGRIEVEVARGRERARLTAPLSFAASPATASSADHHVGDALAKALENRLSANEPRGEPAALALPAVEPDAAMVLRAGSGLCAAGAPLTLELATPRPNAPLVVAVSQRGELVAQRAVIFPLQSPNEPVAAQSVRVTLPEKVAGLLRVTIFDGSQAPPQPLAERWMFRRPSRFLRLEADSLPLADPASEGVQVNIRALDERGAPAEAKLTIRIAEEGITAQSRGERTAGTGLAANRIPPSEDDLEAAVFAADNAGCDEATLALLLGVPPAMIADDSQRSPTHDRAAPHPHAVPLVADSLPEVRQAAISELTDLHRQRREAVRRLGRWAFCGGGLLFLGSLWTGIRQNGFSAWYWTPTLAASLICLGLGGAWLSVDRAPEVQLAASTPYDFPSALLGDVRTADFATRTASRASSLGNPRLASPSSAVESPEQGESPWRNAMRFSEHATRDGLAQQATIAGAILQEEPTLYLNAGGASAAPTESAGQQERFPRPQTTPPPPADLAMQLQSTDAATESLGLRSPMSAGLAPRRRSAASPAPDLPEQPAYAADDSTFELWTDRAGEAAFVLAAPNRAARYRLVAAGTSGDRQGWAEWSMAPSASP